MDKMESLLMNLDGDSTRHVIQQANDEVASCKKKMEKEVRGVKIDVHNKYQRLRDTEWYLDRNATFLLTWF